MKDFWGSEGAFLPTKEIHREESEMNNDNVLEEINEFYHDELEKALTIMRDIQEMELKYKIKLPYDIKKKVYEFTGEFRFKYVE